MKRKSTVWMSIVLLMVVMLPLAGQEKNPMEVQTSSGSLAWQIEELIKWVIQARDLVPRVDDSNAPRYILTSLQVGGSAEANAFTFTLKGHVLGTRPVQVPLFGRPEEVILRQVTINGNPALVGFDSSQYYVYTGERQFTLNGEFSLSADFSFSVPGPVNLFSASLTKGRIAEGNVLPALSGTTIHVERAGAAGPSAPTTSFFQLSRAYRIQKDVTFEYRIQVQSPSELAQVKLPLKLGETTLDVPGIRGWKQEGSLLQVPVSGRTASFTVIGRLNTLGAIEPDERSTYEWVLIEADPEHRLTMATNASQVDSSESPIQRRLSFSKLYLLSKGQTLKTDVQKLSVQEALAVAVSSHSRRVVWTAEGDLIFQDNFLYQNSGVDFIPYKSSGKTLYLDTDGEPEKILAAEGKKDEILIPMRKGSHAVQLQSIASARRGFLVGLLSIPFPSYPVTITSGGVVVETPANIVPLWLFGGQGYQTDFNLIYVIFILLSLLIAWLAFKPWKSRLAAAAALVGLYLFSPVIYLLLLALCLLVPLLAAIFRRYTSWKKWGAVVLTFLVIFLLIKVLLPVVSLPFRTFMELKASMSSSGVGVMPSGYLQKNYPVEGTIARDKSDFEESKKETYDRFQPQAQIPTKRISQAESISRYGQVEITGESMAEGIRPVPLPLPSGSREYPFWVSRSLFRLEHPFRPRLLYVTSGLIYILVLIWLAAFYYLLFAHRRTLLPKLKKLIERATKKSPPAVG